MNDVEKILKELREEDCPFFSLEDINYYYQKNTYRENDKQQSRKNSNTIGIR